MFSKFCADRGEAKLLTELRSRWRSPGYRTVHRYVVPLHLSSSDQRSACALRRHRQTRGLALRTAFFDLLNAIVEAAENCLMVFFNFSAMLRAKKGRNT